MSNTIEVIDIEIAGRNYPLSWSPFVWERFLNETGKHPVSLFSKIRADMHLALYKGDLGTGSNMVDLMVMCSIVANHFNPKDASRLLYYAANVADGSVTFEEIQEAVHIEGIAPEIEEKDGVKIYTYPVILRKYMDYALGIKIVDVDDIDEEDQKKTSESSRP